MNKKLIVIGLVVAFLFSPLLLNVSQAGTTWTIATVDSSADDVGLCSSLAFDAAGFPCISYYDSTVGNLKFARKIGSTWYTESVATAGNVGAYSSLAFDGAGYPCISYYDRSNGYLRYAWWTGSAWSEQLVDWTGHVGLYTSLAFNDSGYPCISYYDLSNGDLKFARGTILGWNIQTVDSTGNVGEYTSLAFDESGYPCISYYDETNGDLKFARGTILGWNIQTVDWTGDVGSFNSLALHPTGYIYISYYDSSNWDLKLAGWTGSYWSTQTVDSLGEGSADSSLAFDDSGYPCISYFDSSYGGDLKFARKTGSAPWSIQTVDSTGGLSMSLGFNHVGIPFISYYDYTNDNLKCAFGQDANPTCSITINSGAAYTNSQSVTLALSYTAYGATITDVAYSNSWVGDWESPAATKDWTLTSGDGPKTVYYRVMDSDGMISPTASDNITLDTAAPGIPVPDDGVDGWSNDNTPEFSWSPVSDGDGSGVAGYYYKIGSGGDETWTTGTSVTVTAQPDGIHTFYVRAVDIAGNYGSYGTHDFQIDTELSRDALWNRLVDIILEWPTSTPEQRAELWEEIVEIILLWPTAP